jgi:CBS domain-containing protein
MQLLRVADAMQPLPAALQAGAPLNEVIARLGESPTDGLPVADANGLYRGTVSSQQVEQAMRDKALDACAGDLAQDLPALTGEQSLEDALGALLRARSGLPVVAGDGEQVPVGWLTHLDVLRAYNARLERGLEQAQPEPRSPDRRREPGRLGTAFARLRGYRIVDLELATSALPVGRRVGDLPWPPRSAVLAIRRGERAFEPTAAERLEQGDRLTILVPASATDGLVDTITDEDTSGRRSPRAAGTSIPP